MKRRERRTPTVSAVIASISLGVIFAASAPDLSAQSDWLNQFHWRTSAAAAEGGNWTDPAIWDRLDIDGGGNPIPPIFPDDDYPGHVTPGTSAEWIWVDARHGVANPLVVDSEITYTGRLDATEGAAGGAYLRITSTGILTVNPFSATDHPFRFGLGGNNPTILEIDGGTLAGPAGITWIGSWSGSAEINLTNGGTTDFNESYIGRYNGNSVINIDDGVFNTNRLQMGNNDGMGRVNLIAGEFNVRGPINGQPPTFVIGAGGLIDIVDGTLWGSPTSIAGGLTGANIANWVQLGRITSASSSSLTRDWAYTGWRNNIRWQESEEGVLVWAIPEGGMLQGPQNQFVPAGADATFSATVTFPEESGTVTYKWQKDGVDLSGQTETTLNLENLTSADAGTYAFVVTETSGEIVSTATATAVLVVVDDDAPVLISADMNVAGAAMSGYGSLRTTGVVPFEAPNGGGANPMQIGEGGSFWNNLPAGTGTVNYTNLMSSDNRPLPGVTVTVQGGTGAGDAPTGGFIDAPVTEWSGPLLRDFVYTTGEDVMTVTVGGLSKFAGRNVILVVYALGPQSTIDIVNEHTRDDIATVRLASINNYLNLDPVVTDTAGQGRDLRFNDRAFAAFEGRIASSGVVGWTVGPVPGTPGWNAMNGFEILITNQGEAVDLTEIEEWRQAHFGTTENTGSAADDADFIGDGIKNLIKYAVGADPTIPGDASSRLIKGTTAQIVHAENFGYSHDFIANGVEGTPWDRVVQGTRVHGDNLGPATGVAIEARNGVLYMTSSASYGDGNPVSIARSVPRNVNFRATVQLVSAPSATDIFDRPWVNWTAPQIYIGRSDNPAGISHYVSAHFFDVFSLGNGMQVVNNFGRTHDGTWAPQPTYAWMGIEFNHEDGQVTAIRSQDGVTWEAYGSQTLAALTDSNAELEIGLMHAIWTNNSPEDVWVEWANFTIEDMDGDYGDTEIDHLSVDFDYVGDPSLTYIIEATNNLSAGWSVLRTYGPFISPGNQLFVDGVSVGSGNSRFIRLRVDRE